MSTASEPLLPGATIGVIGGGQLGRMMALAARRMGYRIVTLDPNPRCPTAQVADGVVVGALDDLDAAMRLASQVGVITLDTEHVPAEVLRAISAKVPVRPGPDVLQTIQDRQTQKQFLDRLGLPQARWRPLAEPGDLHNARRDLGDIIVKVRRSGYDGKGQVRIPRTASHDEATAAVAQLRGQPAVAEEVVFFTREVSVLLARGVGGEIRTYPLAENLHRRHILHTTRVPAQVPPAHASVLFGWGEHVAKELGHVGVIAVELFEKAPGVFLVNEIAPRTHNSGHFSYGACATSQFEQHVRAVCGLPLGDPRLLSEAVMLNLLGDLWRPSPPRWHAVLRHPGARLHLYGKDAAAPGRKMGHVLLLDERGERALALAEEIHAELAE